MTIADKIRIFCQFIGIGILIGVNFGDANRTVAIGIAMALLVTGFILLLANPY